MNLASAAQKLGADSTIIFLLLITSCSAVNEDLSAETDFASCAEIDSSTLQRLSGIANLNSNGQFVFNPYQDNEQ